MSDDTWRSTGDARPADTHHTAAEYALLGLLRAGARHGYVLWEAFAPRGRLALLIRLKRGQMYAYLHKLEGLGWLRARDEEPAGAHPRRIFALTPAGARAFDAWLAAPVVGTRDVRLDFLLKLAFAAEQGSATARDLLERQRAATEALLGRLRARADALGPERDALGRLVLGYRIRLTEATLAWLAEAEDLTL